MVVLVDHFQIVAATATATTVTLPFTAETVSIYNQGPNPVDFTLNSITATYRGARLPSGAALTIDRNGKLGKIQKVSVICDTALTATVNINAWV